MKIDTDDLMDDLEVKQAIRNRWNDRKKVDFLPQGEDEFHTIVNETDEAELLRMGFSELHMGSDENGNPTFPPADKRHFCFPYEWKHLIPSGFEVVALGGDIFPFYANDYPDEFVMDGCLMVGFFRDKLTSNELPEISIK